MRFLLRRKKEEYCMDDRVSIRAARWDSKIHILCAKICVPEGEIQGREAVSRDRGQTQCG